MKRMLVIFLSVGLGVSLQAQSTPPAYKAKIDNLFSKEQQKEMGLDTLNTEQKNKLESWLTDYALKVIKLGYKTGYEAAQSSAPASASTTVPVATTNTIETRIDGDFEGWDGETIFKLENGQIWQQASYSYAYRYAYRPKVTIHRAEGGFKMQVEGMDKTILVKRIK